MKTITNSFAEGVIAMFCSVGRQYTFAKSNDPTAEELSAWIAQHQQVETYGPAPALPLMAVSA